MTLKQDGSFESNCPSTSSNSFYQPLQEVHYKKIKVKILLLNEQILLFFHI